jgi:hypothetical protein
MWDRNVGDVVDDDVLDEVVVPPLALFPPPLELHAASARVEAMNNGTTMRRIRERGYRG